MCNNRLKFGTIVLAVVLMLTGCGKNTSVSDTTSKTDTVLSVISTEISDLIESSKSESYPISFNPDEVMEYPGIMKVNYRGEVKEARVNLVSWAYAVNDKEWSSVNEQNFEAIDGAYDNFFTSSGKSSDYLISFDGITNPDAVLNIKCFPIESWIEDPDADEAKGLRNRLGHLDEYNQYQDLTPTVINNSHYLITVDRAESAGFIVEVKAVWDTDYYRGSCIYSFMVKMEE